MRSGSVDGAFMLVFSCPGFAVAILSVALTEIERIEMSCDLICLFFCAMLDVRRSQGTTCLFCNRDDAPEDVRYRSRLRELTAKNGTNAVHCKSFRKE